MTGTEHEPTDECDHDVVVVGGGPAGCSASVFTARYGLDTVVFDRGRSSIQRCAHLENYLGFPAGIDIETLYELMHDHAAEAGCEIVPDLVESVERADDGDGFVVDPQEGDAVTARRVVAATRYDGEYLRGLDDTSAMFEEYEHDGETHETFDSEYADHDGTTPVDGLYVASPSSEADRQAIVAAGRGARVGLRVVEDTREQRGYPEAVVDHYDWMRKESTIEGEWSDRDRWREWFDEQVPDDHDIDEDHRIELREREIDRSFETYLSDDDIEQRGECGQKRLLERLDDELIRAYVADLDVSEVSK
jgi:threonine dehydrogenase-like Zn-dependent dehydrogenase